MKRVKGFTYTFYNIYKNDIRIRITSQKIFAGY
jgi:hypothetical protein